MTILYVIIIAYADTRFNNNKYVFEYNIISEWHTHTLQLYMYIVYVYIIVFSQNNKVEFYRIKYINDICSV